MRQPNLTPEEQTARREEKKREAIHTIEVGIAACQIYKVEFDDAKNVLNRIVDVEQHGHGSPAVIDQEVYRYMARHDLTPSNVHEVASAIKKLEKQERAAEREAKKPEHYRLSNFAPPPPEVRVFLESWVPIREKIEAAKAFVVKRRPSANPRVTDPRTIINTGSCPICVRNIKMSDSRMVDHGYEIQHSSRAGHCFGVGELAWELSPEGAQKHVDTRLKPRLRVLEARLAKSGDLEQLQERRVYISFDEYREGKRYPVVTQSDAAYPMVLRNFRDETQRKIDSVQEAITYYEGRIAAWVLSPLPEEVARAAGITIP